MTNTNTYLNLAKKAKRDEFYTRYQTIADELPYYTNYFKNKIVYCNSDDPLKSNFVKYFMRNFNVLHLKGLLVTSYNPNGGGKAVELFNLKDLSTASDNQLNKIIQPHIKFLQGNGSFDSPECLSYLQQSDIVVTNPPFSKFRDLFKLLIDYHKDYLLIGTTNMIKLKMVLPLLVANKLFIGINRQAFFFVIPDSYPKYLRKDENGNKIARIANSLWLTSLEPSQDTEPLDLKRSYYRSPTSYQKYEGTNILNVDSIHDIPNDYDGLVGVPISFLQHYNRSQFQIVGKADHGSKTEPLDLCKPMVKGKQKYVRFIIKRK